MNKLLFTIIIILSAMEGFSQQIESSEDIPFREVPDYPDKFTAGTVSARVLDGLGFRFYWATEGLRKTDLDYRPGEEVRSIGETIEHIYSMTVLNYNAVFQSKVKADLEDVFEMRTKALLLIEEMRNKLAESTDEELEGYNLRFRNGSELPFWNLLNGPISDSVWHCGQIVSFRRSAGNPISGNISFMRGSVRN